jgi:hypothetical protein
MATARDHLYSSRTQSTHYESEEKLRNDLSKTLTVSPELYERLFLAPKNDIAGDFRKRFGNPTPVGVLGFSVAVIPLAVSFSESSLFELVQQTFVNHEYSGMARSWWLVCGHNHYQHLVWRNASYYSRLW